MSGDDPILSPGPFEPSEAQSADHGRPEGQEFGQAPDQESDPENDRARSRRDEAPSLEETLGLRGRRKPLKSDLSALERLSSRLGGLFLGRGFRQERPQTGGEESDGLLNSKRVWGWRGAWPMLIGVALGAGAAGAPPVQRAVSDGFERMRAAMVSRPEFAIHKLEVTGMRRLSEADLKRAVQAGGEERAAFAFDYDGARRRIEALGWVKRASVVLQAPNTLAIEIVERRPAALWRRGADLRMIDASGVVIERVGARREHRGLPLLVGPGADRRVDEALDLARVARAGGLHVAALTRVGQRRWDLELSGGPRLMLPEHEPKMALDRAVKWAREAALLERGFEIVDLRLPFAPTARLGAQGTQVFPTADIGATAKP